MEPFFSSQICYFSHNFISDPGLPLIIQSIHRQAPTVYVDPVLVGQLALEEQLGLLSFTISLSIYWQVAK